MKKGFFLTVEGPDGAGKSSLIKIISSWLTDNEKDFLLTKEPGSPHNVICRKIRSIVLDPENKIDSEAEIYLMLADRCNHVNQVILPALKSGKIVISDRYMDSTYAYQGWGRNYGDHKRLEYIELMNEKSTNHLMPDLTIILWVDPKVGLSRISKSEFGKEDRFESEKIEFHQRVCDGYKNLYHKYKKNRNFLIVDTTHQNEQQTGDFVLKQLEDVLFRSV